VAGKVFICYYILDCVIFIAKLIILILQWSATVLQYKCINGRKSGGKEDMPEHVIPPFLFKAYISFLLPL
jgi:hypothetical protein